MRPTTGTSGPNAVVLPTISSHATRRGSRSPSSPKIPRSSGSQRVVSRSRTSDLLAVVTSLTNSPVRWWTSQASVVVTTPSRVTLRRSQVILGAEKYGSRTRPVRRAMSAACAERSAQIPAERLSCHTIACDSGWPVRGFHASTVSPWFASATASIGRPAAAHALRPASRTEARSPAGSCSTPPPSRYTGRTGTSTTARNTPASSTTIAFVPDVP
ncbi:unannotated protein [freshwater metagenome]|uniref:Unannotated protein n=1 Tax=freshwater metagenome TaxID=449393 RepID=A0A6J7L5V2_9ZZZZ